MISSRMLNISMVIGHHYEYAEYSRSRNGKKHTLVRRHKVYELRCDECGNVFMKTSKELRKPYGSHCCSNCNHYKFAQKQSAILRQYNKWDASSSRNI